jgi:hypothetical protein
VAQYLSKKQNHAKRQEYMIGPSFKECLLQDIELTSFRRRQAAPNSKGRSGQEELRVDLSCDQSGVRENLFFNVIKRLVALSGGEALSDHGRIDLVKLRDHRSHGVHPQGPHVPLGRAALAADRVGQLRQQRGIKADAHHNHGRPEPRAPSSALRAKPPLELARQVTMLSRASESFQASSSVTVFASSSVFLAS